MLDNFRNKVISGSFYIGAASIISMLSAYAVNVYLARYLSPVPFGVYSLVISLLTALNIMQSTGLPQVITKKIAECPNQSAAILRNGLRLHAKLTIVLTFLYAALAYPIAYLLNDHSLVPYILLSVLILPAYGTYALFLGYHNGLHDYKRLALANSVYSISKLIFIIFLVSPFGLNGAIGGFILAPLIALLVIGKAPKNINTIASSDLMEKCFPMIGYAVFSNLLLCIDIIILKALNASALDVGCYAAAQNIARLPYVVIGVFAYTLYPAIAKLLASDDNQGAHVMLRENVKLVIFLLVPVTMIIMVSAPQITKMLFGEAYIHGAEALPVLMVGGGLLTIFNLFAYVLNGAGKVGTSVTLAVTGLAISVLACFFLIRLMGMIGAAYGICAGAMFALAGASLCLHRVFKGFFPLKSLIYSLVLSSLLVLPLIEYKPEGVALLLSYLSLFSVYIMILMISNQFKWPIKVRA